MKRIGAALVVVLFVAALYVLHRELKHVPLADVRAAFQAIPVGDFLLAFLLTGCSYLVLVGYDAIGLRYAGRPLSFARTAMASFMAYAIGHNLGAAMLTGGSVRYRLYSRAGLSAVEIGKVVAICTVTFGLGVTAVFAVVCAVVPGDVTPVLHVGEIPVRGAGILILLCLAAYTLWNAFRRTPIEVRGLHFILPGLRMTVLQFGLAGLDLVVAASVLYVLLPHVAEVSFTTFLGVYVVATAVAILSHVPGGIGVFEAVLVSVMPGIAPDLLLASVLAYRVLYYLLPLAVASLMLALHELDAYRAQLITLAERSGSVIGGVAPRALGMLVFTSGTLLLFSGATPAVEERLHWLAAVMPLPVVEVSHLAGSVVGLALLFIARGLFLRLGAAWYATLLLLLSGSLLSLLKGLDWEEAGLLATTLVVLLSGRREFYRAAALSRVRFTAGWFGAISLVILASIWLGLFSYKHVEYTQQVWWQYALDSQAPRFLRASLLAVIAALAFGGWYLMRPLRAEPRIPDADALDRARPVVQASGSSEAWLAMVGDKRLLFNDDADAFIMYGIQGRSWIAMGDPVGPEERWEDLLWEFRELVDRHAGRPALYQVDGAKLPYYLDLGLQAQKLGEQARVALPAFSLEGSHRADLRQARRRAQRDGVSFEVLPPEAVDTVLAQLERISDQWLASKNTAEKRFSVGYFSRDYIARLPCAVVRYQGVPVAFANLWPGAGLEELSVDLMRFGATAPKGVMDYLFTELLLWGRDEGYRWFNLGMAPLSGLEDHALAPSWHRVGSFVFRHGEHFYNFEGLRAYKEKFNPVWTPRYLVTRGGFGAARALLDVGILISGGMKGAFKR